ncbi:unnamed protein product [Strongylus vulgaris]|uniref:G-protein coupled receptors family 1 profile domain-containing protein n=1 Tax=Strongylus vulgaris TaxID=40348 RepID=A0A3P7IT44_STRVU|nr:unnamed protein product [Strongylus vulgaris]
MSQWSFSAVRVHLTAGGTTAIARGPHTPNVLALLLLPILCLVGLIGNAMVCIAIATDRRLHNVTNYFLFSLALADLLVCLLVMPLSIIVEVKHGVWTWNVSLCLLYVYSDVFLCSASIVHMSVISLDRYSNGYHNSIVELEAQPRMGKNSGVLTHKSLAKRSTINRWKSRTSSYLSNIALRVGRRNSLQAASQELANEHKATRVLAVVFICFFICWTPFFVANFIVAFVRILRCQCCHAVRDPSSLYSRNYTTIAPDTFTWFVCFSSFTPSFDKYIFPVTNSRR